MYCHFLLNLIEIQVRYQDGWLVQSILLNFLENEAFPGEALVLGEVSFLILLYLV